MLTNDTNGPYQVLASPTGIEFAALQRGLILARKNPLVRLMRCGVGEAQAAEFCRQLEGLPINGLALLGWAGGLRADLKAGHVVLATQALREGRPAVECRLLDLPGAILGPILTVPTALLTAQEKIDAQASGALAVEMEAYPLAEWAARRGLPFLHARVILDAFDESLPDIGPGLDASGNVKVGPFLRQLIRQPKMLVELGRLSGRVRQVGPALQNLAFEISNRLT